MTFDPRREAWLEAEITRLQTEKLIKLQAVRTVRGAEKASLLDQFLDLHKKQEKLESELEDLQDY